MVGTGATEVYSLLALFKGLSERGLGEDTIVGMVSFNLHSMPSGFPLEQVFAPNGVGGSKQGLMMNKDVAGGVIHK